MIERHLFDGGLLLLAGIGLIHAATGNAALALMSIASIAVCRLVKDTNNND